MTEWMKNGYFASISALKLPEAIEGLSMNIARHCTISLNINNTVRMPFFVYLKSMGKNSKLIQSCVKRNFQTTRALPLHLSLSKPAIGKSAYFPKSDSIKWQFFIEYTGIKK